MSNYYHRDNEGNWFISSHDILTQFEYSDSMEIAYVMGKISALEELKGDLDAQKVKMLTWIA